MYNILVCDDESDIVSAIKIYLETEGYQVFKASNGEEALQMVQKEQIDLIVMDVMMPVMDGIKAVRKLRENSIIPVIMLTAKSEDADKVLGLGIGADDYITKPFNPIELVARVKSQLRRYKFFGGKPEEEKEKVEGILKIGGLTMNIPSREVIVEGNKVDLTPKEFDILKTFLKNKGIVLSPDTIYRKVWGDEPYGAETTVAVHIRHLREKIEINPSEPRYIKVVWGQGYKMEKE